VLPAEVVVLKLFGPLQLYETRLPEPETEPAFKVSVAPLHILVVDGVILATVGIVFTVAVLVYVVVQPDPVPLLTTTV
jgi:hypothetical protein